MRASELIAALVAAIDDGGDQRVMLSTSDGCSALDSVVATGLTIYLRDPDRLPASEADR